MLRGLHLLIFEFIDWLLDPAEFSGKQLHGDLSCDSERVLMEGHNISFICEDDPVLLEEALPPAGQTLCSCGELRHGQNGTRIQCMNDDSLETELDVSGSPSLGIKSGKGGDGNTRVISDCSEPNESSTCECPPSFLVN